MGVIATAVKHLLAAGVTGDALLSAIEEIEAAIAHPIDEQAERRRRLDRERKAAKKPIPQNSAESAECENLPPNGFPDPSLTPSQKPPTGVKRVPQIPIEAVTLEKVAEWADQNIPKAVNRVRELEKFKNHEWRKKKPTDGIKAFRNWLLKAAEFHENDNPPETPWHKRPENRMPSPAGG